MIKQCAWCKSLTLNGIKIRSKENIVPGMSHGICLSCKIELVKDYNRSNMNALPRTPLVAAAV